MVSEAAFEVFSVRRVSQFAHYLNWLEWYSYLFCTILVQVPIPAIMATDKVALWLVSPSSREVSAGTWRQELMRRPWRSDAYRMLLMACSAAFVHSSGPPV